MKKIPALSPSYILLYIFFVVVFLASIGTSIVLAKTGDYFYIILAAFALIYSLLYMAYYFRIYVKLSPAQMIISRIMFYDAGTADCAWWETLAFRARGKVQRLEKFTVDFSELERYGYNKEVDVHADRATEADASYPYEVSFVFKSGEHVSWNIKPYSASQISRIVSYIARESNIKPTGHLSQYL